VAKTKAPASQFARYIGPVIQAIRELGGSGRPDEVRGVIARDLRMSDSEQSEPLPSGVQTRFENQVHWARFYLAKAGYIDSSQRGVWTLTEKGRALGGLPPAGFERFCQRKEAVRDGAPPIELVDGEKLAGMMERLELGLRPRQTFELDAAFFNEYQK
jgi:restriction endonuclease Mrr